MLTFPMAAKLRVKLLKISCMPADRVKARSGLMARRTRSACSAMLTQHYCLVAAQASITQGGELWVRQLLASPTVAGCLAQRGTGGANPGWLLLLPLFLPQVPLLPLVMGWL